MNNPTPSAEPGTGRHFWAQVRLSRADLLLAFLFSCISLPLIAGVGSAYSLGEEFRTFSLLLPLPIVLAILFHSRLFTQTDKFLRLIALLGFSVGVMVVAYFLSSAILFVLWAQSAP